MRMTAENAIIKTSYGDMTIAFWPEVAPKHVENFKKLAREGFEVLPKTRDFFAEQEKKLRRGDAAANVNSYGTTMRVFDSISRRADSTIDLAPWATASRLQSRSSAAFVTSLIVSRSIWALRWARSRPAASAPSRTQSAFCAIRATVESGSESTTDQVPEVWRGMIDTASASRPPRCMTARPPPPMRRRGRTGTRATIGESVTLKKRPCMVVDGSLAFIVVWKLWKFKAWQAALMVVPLVVIDSTFFTANLLKLVEGGWVPLLFGITMVLLMLTWRRGTNLLANKTRRIEVPLDTLIRSLEKNPPHVVPGTAVFLTGDPYSAPTPK